MSDLLAREITRIPVVGPRAMLGAMAYLAVVAYPEDNDKRKAFILGCGAWLARLHLREGDRGPLPANLPAEIKEYPTRRIWETGPLRNGVRRLQKCGQAAEVALHLMLPAGFGNKHRGITAVLKIVGGDVAGDVPKVRKSIWRPSRPVLHLAIALNGAGRGIGSDDRLHDLIIHPDWLPAALKAAELLRRQFDAATPFANGHSWPDKLHIPAAETIQLLPA